MNVKSWSSWSSGSRDHLKKVRRAQILLKADAPGPNWTDANIAEAFSRCVQTLENLRKRFVTEGFDVALHGKGREAPPRRKCLDGKQEAKVIALRLGAPRRDIRTGRFDGWRNRW